MNLPRPPKESALRFAEKMAPLYAEVFHELKADGGRLPSKRPGNAVLN
jgi:hypothetical protein